MNFNKVHNDFFELNKREGEITSPPGNFYESVESQELPRASYIVSDEFISIYFENLPQKGSVGSSIHPEFKYPISKLTNFVHDFTFNYITPHTDVALYDSLSPLIPAGTPFPSIRALTEVTPDFVHCSEPKNDMKLSLAERFSDRLVTIIEFGTQSIPLEANIEKYYDEKNQKYTLAAQQVIDIIRGTFVIGCIIVSPSIVLSNVNLTQNDVEELCFRFRIANAVSKLLQSQGFEITKLNPYLEMKVAESKKMFNSIELDFKKTEAIFPQFKKTNYDIALEPLSPSEIEYVQKLQKKVLAASTDHILQTSYLDKSSDFSVRTDMNVKECKNEILKHITTRKTGPIQDVNHKKRIVHLPYWVVKPTEPTTTISEQGYLSTIIPTDEPTHKMWAQAISSYDFDLDQKFFTENLDQEFNIATMTQSEYKKIEEANKNKRDQYRRVRLNLKGLGLEEIAHKGFFGKKFKTLTSVIKKKLESKKAINFDVDLSDLDKFIETGSESLSKKMDESNSRTDFLETTAGQGMRLHGNLKGENICKHYKTFNKTYLALWTQLLSDIGHELAISLRQGCKPNEFIFKKLKHWPVWMLINSASSTKPIKYSLLIHKKDLLDQPNKFENVFAHTFDSGPYCWTEMIAINPSKLENLSKIDSTTFAVFSYWAEALNCPFWSAGVESPLNAQKPKTQELWKNCLLNLLVALEDKNSTEKTGIAFRFIAMEGFVAQPLLPKPYKMLPKLPGVIRSRLQLWMEKKMIGACERICMTPFTPESLATASGKLIQWNNLFNPYTNYPITDVATLISLMYITYVKNKNESAEKNQGMQLVTKILELEEKLDKSSQFLGMKDPPVNKIQTHEYSISFLKHLIEKAKTFLQKTNGQSVMEDVESRINCALYDIDIESMATLKATSSFDETWFSYEEVKKLHKDPNKAYHRRRVAEALLDFTEKKSLRLLDAIPKALNYIESKGAMFIDIFKKPQHGDIREIYVMHISNRIVQLAIETISRTLCSLFQSETMTHPENKAKIVLQHHARARKHFGDTYITSCASDDAQKWSQSNYVKKFAQMLVAFTPNYMHGLIWRGLSMFMNKFIMLDLSIFQTINAHLNDFKTANVYYQKIYEIYTGRTTDCDWYHGGDTFIRTESGMMQGVLHYTSSLLQACFQEYIKGVTLKVFRESFQVNEDSKVNCVASVLESSDDSANMTSFKALTPEEVSNGLFLCAVIYRFKATICTYLGIYPSVKCTQGTVALMEFNSEFYSWKDIIRPLIKWVNSCLVMPESESLGARLEQASSALTGVIEGGGSCSLASFVQICQANIHYRAIGLYVNPLFETYSQIMDEVKDPSLGYFVFDDPYMAGLPGLRYNIWNLLHRTNLSKLYVYKIMRVIVETSKDDDKYSRKVDWDLASSGMLIQSLGIPIRGTDKWDRLKESLDLPEDFEEFFDQVPLALYNRPENIHHMLNRMALKFNTVGVMQSISNLANYARVLSSAAYVLNRPVVAQTLAEAYYGSGHKSLIKIALETQDLLEEADLMLDESELDLIENLFPFSHDYIQIRAELINFGESKPHFQSIYNRKIKTTVKITESLPDLALRAEDLTKKQWFNIDVRMNETLFRALWQNLKRLIPWVRDTAKETLEASPFKHQSQLRNFFSRLDQKRRQVVMLSEPIRKLYGFSNLPTAARVNFFPGYRLNIPTDQVAEVLTEGRTTSQYLSTLALAVSSYLNAEQSKKLVCSIIRGAPMFSLKESAHQSKKNTLHFIKRVCSLDLIKNKTIRKLEVGDILQRMSLMKLGTIGGIIDQFDITRSYSDKGVRTTLSGTSTWIGTYDGIPLHIHLGLPQGKNTRKDVTICAIVVSSLVNVDSLRSSLLAINSSFQWKTDSKLPLPKFLINKHPILCFTGKEVINIRRRLGVPIFVNNEIISLLTPEIVDDFQIRVDANRVVIDAIIPENYAFGVEKPLQVLSLKLDVNNIDPNNLPDLVGDTIVLNNNIIEYKPGLNIMSYWLTNKSCPSSLFMKCVQTIMKIQDRNNPMSRKTDFDPIRSASWIRKVFIDAIILTGAVSHSELLGGIIDESIGLPTQTAVETINLSVDLDRINKMMQSNIMEIATNIQSTSHYVADSEQSMIEQADFDEEESHQWSLLISLDYFQDLFSISQEVNLQVLPTTFYHNIARDFVGELLQGGNLNQVKRMFSQKNIIPFELIQFKKEIAFLLNVPESQLVVHRLFFDDLDDSDSDSLM